MEIRKKYKGFYIIRCLCEEPWRCRDNREWEDKLYTGLIQGVCEREKERRKKVGRYIKCQ